MIERGESGVRSLYLALIPSAETKSVAVTLQI